MELLSKQACVLVVASNWSHQGIGLGIVMLWTCLIYRSIAVGFGGINLKCFSNTFTTFVHITDLFFCIAVNCTFWDVVAECVFRTVVL